MKIILASGSPRRRELLAQLFPVFEVMATDADENVGDLPPGEYVGEAARRKLDSALSACEGEDALIIAADTVVISPDGAVCGKPDGTAGAEAMLALLSGRTHSVWTGIALGMTCGGRTDYVSGAEETRVTFRHMTAGEIAEYAATGEPLDKSGSYAIQGGAAKFAERIDGEVDNVVGLPAKLLRRLAAELRASNPACPEPRNDG